VLPVGRLTLLRAICGDKSSPSSRSARRAGRHELRLVHSGLKGLIAVAAAAGAPA
jgi:hypothetical protein